MNLQITAIGNLVENPKEAVLPSGTPCSNFFIMTNRSWTDRDGVKHERVTRLGCSVTNGQAKACNDYLVKGQQVFVTGYLLADKWGNPETYTSKDGNPRASFKMRCTSVTFGAKPKSYYQNGAQGYRANGSAPADPGKPNVTVQANGLTTDDDGIPF